MPEPFARKIASPMLGLGLLLLATSGFAAWKIHERQAAHSSLVAREVRGLLAVSEVGHAMRDVRHEINLFLRTRSPRHLRAALELGGPISERLESAAALLRTTGHDRPLETLEDGYRRYRGLLEDVATPLVESTGDAAVARVADEDDIRTLAELADERMASDLLAPLFGSISVNRGLLDGMNDADRATARQLTFGLLMLGFCGAAAGIAFGVTAARSITRQLRAGEREILRREQLAEVGQMAAGLAHELRNPLMPLKMIVQAAKDRPNPSVAGRSLDVMHEEITRLERAIDAFLDFARPPRAEKATADVRELVAPTLDLVATRAARQGVSIETQLPATSATANIDRGMIRQVLLNLLLNALDALPRGGRLAVRVEELAPRRESRAGVAARGAGSGGTLLLRVSDDGPGIPPQILPKVLDPFVTTKESGLGLGLSLCSRIAAAHGGRITARNLTPCGAEFALELPLAASSPPLQGTA